MRWKYGQPRFCYTSCPTTASQCRCSAGDRENRSQEALNEQESLPSLNAFPPLYTCPLCVLIVPPVHSCRFAAQNPCLWVYMSVWCLQCWWYLFGVLGLDIYPVRVITSLPYLQFHCFYLVCVFFTFLLSVNIFHGYADYIYMRERERDVYSSCDSCFAISYCSSFPSCHPFHIWS